MLRFKILHGSRCGLCDVKTSNGSNVIVKPCSCRIFKLPKPSYNVTYNCLKLAIIQKILNFA